MRHVKLLAILTLAAALSGCTVSNTVSAKYVGMSGLGENTVLQQGTTITDTSKQNSTNNDNTTTVTHSLIGTWDIAGTSGTETYLITSSAIWLADSNSQCATYTFVDPSLNLSKPSGGPSNSCNYFVALISPSDAITLTWVDANTFTMPFGGSSTTATRRPVVEGGGLPPAPSPLTVSLTDQSPMCAFVITLNLSWPAVSTADYFDIQIAYNGTSFQSLAEAGAGVTSYKSQWNGNYCTEGSSFASPYPNQHTVCQIRSCNSFGCSAFVTRGFD